MNMSLWIDIGNVAIDRATNDLGIPEHECKQHVSENLVAVVQSIGGYPSTQGSGI